MSGAGVKKKWEIIATQEVREQFRSWFRIYVSLFE
jgi:hypothetical protein